MSSSPVVVSVDFGGERYTFRVHLDTTARLARLDLWSPDGWWPFESSLSRPLWEEIVSRAIGGPATEWQPGEHVYDNGKTFREMEAEALARFRAP